ncbi:MAG: virginiamycin lyase [Solirubrobacteraceae bacterium]|nr:virginiamycin lyase [Solirubrobacteraceae bacterium]
MATPEPETDVVAAGAETIALTGDWLAAGEGGVWLSGETDIFRMDPATGRRVATIHVPEGPGEASDIGFGALWTATIREPGIARIDPASNRVAAHIAVALPPRLGGEGSIGAGLGAVWVVTEGAGCDSCRVARIDPAGGIVVASIPIEDGGAGVRVGEDRVWVTNPARDLVQEIDPSRDEVVRTTGVGPSPRFMAVGEGAAWTLNQGDGTITRIDPATGDTTTIDAGVPGGGGDLTTGAGSVWARGSRRLLTRIDAETGAVAERYGPRSGSGAVILGFGALWISAHDIDTVWRLRL